jgi:hypothetical protein
MSNVHAKILWQMCSMSALIAANAATAPAMNGTEIGPSSPKVGGISPPFRAAPSC